MYRKTTSHEHEMEISVKVTPLSVFKKTQNTIKREKERKGRILSTVDVVHEKMHIIISNTLQQTIRNEF